MAMLINRDTPSGSTKRRSGTWASNFWMQWVYPARWNIAGLMFLALLVYGGYSLFSNVGTTFAGLLHPCGCLGAGG